MDNNAKNTAADFVEKPTYDFLKRIIDILFSSYSLIIFSPVLFLVTLYYKMHDGGSPYEKTACLGLNKKIFEMYSFRCVYMETGELTALSKFLHATAFDKLPRLINIVKGEMSLIGPKPDNANKIKYIKDYQNKKYLVKPGLTCYFEENVNSKNEDGFYDVDIAYADKRGFFEDLKLIYISVIRVPKLKAKQIELGVNI